MQLGAARPPPSAEKRPVHSERSLSEGVAEAEVDTGSFHPGYPRPSHPLDPSRDAIEVPSSVPPTSAAHSFEKEGLNDPGLEEKYELAPLIFSTATTAQWRRRGTSWDSRQDNRQSRRKRHPPQPTVETRPLAKTISNQARVAGMEEVHGVDVSWLHHPNKDKDKDKEKEKDKAQHGHKRHISAAPVFNSQARLPEGTNVNAAQKKQDGENGAKLSKLPSPPHVTPPTPVQPSKDSTPAVPSTPTPASNGKSQAPKRPNIIGRQSSVGEDSKAGSRRQSWMNSLSSKFGSSQATPQRPSPTPTQSASKVATGAPLTAVRSASSEEATEEVEQYTPPKQKDSSFFSSLTRRLSSASQSSGIPKVQGTGGVCARKVLNVDPNRERCQVPEMDPNKLRKVSFCVDVEIAGGPRYDDDEDDEARDRRKKDFKMRERAEGEALKNPEALKEEKDEEGEPKLEQRGKAIAIPGKSNAEKGSDENLGPRKNSLEDDAASARRREKKKKSEEERKERKKKRRRRAEENGSIPVELSLDGEDDDTKAGSSPSSVQSKNTQATPQQTPATPTQQDRPTTDPARVYRRCCQLRETPILKRITEQLMNPKSTLPAERGVVNLLDLTGSRLQLADVVSLGDWLAVVPVKHLKLEDADLNDEGVRCILAGLLAAKIPEPSKRKSLTPKHRNGVQQEAHRERTGVVEKITFKNNPRITRVGWKHISLFLYMCRSLKAIDVSMNQFPDTLPPSTQNTPVKSPSPIAVGKEDVDAAEILYKCLSERLGGSKLEELIMSECALSADQMRKVIDGAIFSGVSRLGLAGNQIEDEGLEHIIHYLRSGVCQALDLGGNDMRGKLGVIAEAIRSKATDLPWWGLSLAGCNLDPESLKPLFAALQQLPNFRFIDLSHNRDLCSADNGLISLLRLYISRMKNLKRVHLTDVGMSSRQAIALADVLSEGLRLAHLCLLENPKLTALANAKTEEDQEEACALYASLMAAVRVSSTLICIDIDVPSPDSSELVKALAKQVVAYSLRNMEQFAIAEATGMTTANATAALTGPHGGEKVVKDLTVPDVLWQLVGHVEGSSENHDNDPPAPDEDYIVGGTGVVKALQYVLAEKNDGRRTSIPQTPRSGAVTPTQRPDSSAGFDAEQKGKAKKMSKSLLDSARKVRHRLRPALVKEAAAGDEMAYRRLLFLDQTLQSMIERFEEEYPECRIERPAQVEGAATSENSSLTDKSNTLASSLNTQGTEPTNISDDEDFMDADDGEGRIRPTVSRHNSDVSLASRKQVLEEGHLHRLGMHLRREIIDSSAAASPTTSGGAADDIPPSPAAETPIADIHKNNPDEQERIRLLGQRLEGLSGVDMKRVLEESQSWEHALKAIGANYEDLRTLQQLDPEGWEWFKEAQLKARANVERERGESVGG